MLQWEEEERLDSIDEEEYSEVCKPFRGTYIEEVHNTISAEWKIGRMRFLMKPPRSCLSWHRDPERRIHIPIITNPGCRMVIEDESFHMPADGSVYITCLLYTSPSPRDGLLSRMPSSA